MRILIINGHPFDKSFNRGLAEAYEKGAKESGAEVQVIHVSELNFNPILEFGYRKVLELEPDLIDAQKKILWAEHIVIIHPLWWGSMPALLKGFIDRVFLPGFAFKYRANSVWWDKLLKGRTARIICTSDQPYYYNRWVYGRPGINQLKKMILEFCGIKPVKVTWIAPIRNSTEEFRKKWIEKIYRLGTKMG